ncbi:MAG: hypothetical protein DRO88_11595 [Promethearchaeia archaeon]|nr:MAG: hypothetical protein DRO88_11595 [Candidatus Lokiarchaeia archaeon]
MAKKKTTGAKKTKRTAAAKKSTKKTGAKSKPKKAPIEDDEIDEEEDGPDGFEEDLEEMEDEMLADDSDVKPRSNDEILNMLREVECADCEGSSTRDRCKVRDQYGCPPEKANL